MNRLKEKNMIKDKRSEILIYFLVAFGFNYMFGIPLLIKLYVNPQFYSNFMVLLPMNAVFLVKVYKKEDLGKDKPIYYIMFGLFAFYFVMMLCEIAGILGDKAVYWATQIVMTICSVLIAGYTLSGKGEKRILENGGLVHKAFFVMISVLVVKCFLNLIGTQSDYAEAMFGRIGGLFMLPVGLFLVIPSYIGEEYGWRGYLQGIMQQKFGKRYGVILLGIIWELWHIPLWFNVYNLKVWELPIRMLMAISMAIFIGYIYMKAQNIWLCVWAHYIYNTLSQISGIGINESNQKIVVIVGTIALIASIVILSSFLLKSEYGVRKKDKASEDK